MKHIKLYENYTKDCDSCEEYESPRSNRRQSQGDMGQVRKSNYPSQDYDHDDSDYDEFHHEFPHRDQYDDREPDEYDVDDFGYKQHEFSRDYYSNPKEDYEMDDDDEDLNTEYQPKFLRSYEEEPESQHMGSQAQSQMRGQGQSQRFPQSQMEEDEEMYDSYAWRNRINERKAAKKRKPDFLDFDKDGDKKETMKKALKDKEKAQGRFGRKSPKEAQKKTTTRRKR